jgi:hypothetical protein
MPNNDSIKNATTKILDCGCDHDFQDKRYGKGKRVHNPAKADNGVKYRCTVCGKEQKN